MCPYTCAHTDTYTHSQYWDFKLNCIQSKNQCGKNCHLYNFLRAATTKSYKLSGFNWQTYISLAVLEDEVWYQGVGRALLPLKRLGKRPSLPLPSSCWLPPVLGDPWLEEANFFFVGLFAISVSSLGRCLLRSLAHFLKFSCLFSYCWVLKVPCILWIKVLFHISLCKYLLAVFGLSSHSLDSDFYREEVVNFNETQLVTHFFHRSCL